MPRNGRITHRKKEGRGLAPIMGVSANPLPGSSNASKNNSGSRRKRHDLEHIPH